MNCKRVAAVLAAVLLMWGGVGASAATGVDALIVDVTGGEITFRTEYDVYPANTRYIVGIWENKSGGQILHGDEWRLERKVDGVWKRVDDIDDGWARPFYTVGHPVAAGATEKRIYMIDHFTLRLKLGKYRITSGVYWDGSDQDYRFAAEFQVIAPIDFKGFGDTDPRRTDWKYEDITPAGLLYEASPRVYRHAKTGETFLVDGGKRYPLGEGTQGKGLQSVSTTESGGRPLLLYTEQRGAGKTAYSRVGVYDLGAHKDRFLSRRYYGRELELWFCTEESEGYDGIQTYEACEIGDKPGVHESRGARVATLGIADGKITYTPV